MLPHHDDVTLEVGARWGAVSVCGYPDAPEVIVQYERREDAAEVTLPCRADSLEVTAIPVTFAGTTAPASIFVGPYSGEVISGGAGVLYAEHGVWPLTAAEQAQNPRVVIDRGISVDTGTPASLAIDFDRDGFAMDERAVTVDGSLGNDNVYSNIFVDGTTPLWMLGGPFAKDQVDALPADRVAADDVEWVEASSWRADGAWGGEEAKLGADPIHVSFPAPLDSSEILDDGRIEAHWTTRQAWDEVTLFVVSRQPSSGAQWSVDDYDTSAGAITFPRLDTIGPWQPAWDLDPTAPVQASLTLSQHLDDGTRRAGWSATFN